MKSKYPPLLIIFILLLTWSCREDYTPKPRGYLKVSYPEHEYKTFRNHAPFTFEYPAYAKVVADTSPNAEPYWYNILLPPFNGTIYLSYKDVNNDLQGMVEDSRKLAYKHSIKAEAIDESLISNPDANVYGILYDLKGNTASALQFFVTDSTDHFLRGSLYFNTQPDKDSLAPVIHFVREDIKHLIGTIKWQE